MEKAERLANNCPEPVCSQTWLFSRQQGCLFVSARGPLSAGIIRAEKATCSGEKTVSLAALLLLGVGALLTAVVFN